MMCFDVFVSSRLLLLSFLMQRHLSFDKVKVKSDQLNVVTPEDVSLQSYWAYRTADCKDKLITFSCGVPQGSSPGQLLLMSSSLC